MAVDLLQKGSTRERSAWMARVRRMIRDDAKLNGRYYNVQLALAVLLQYGRDREIRTGRRKGSL